MMNLSAQNVTSRLQIIDVKTKKCETVYETEAHFEALNWSRNGKYLIFNQDGKLYKLDLKNPEPQLINTAFADRCNNDHGISPDGKSLVISNNDSVGSRIYHVPIEGGTPKLVTNKAPSYWHGWSPDGKVLTYCAERNGNYDIYTIPIEGGPETRLTDTEGLDDGPEYSPDGKYIYFNSVRTGRMHIWRMKTDGSEQEQITKDEYNNWFAHPSPNGKQVVFITYIDDVEPGSHPAFKKVMLRTMDLDGNNIEKLIELFGGQGTINVPSWSPDSQRVAFVSYSVKN